jgi:uncharacterized membrane protein YtjA (UPF0391 family)
MLKWTAAFLIGAFITGILGFTNVAGSSPDAIDLAQILFLVFLLFAFFSLLFGKKIII